MLFLSRLWGWSAVKEGLAGLSRRVTSVSETLWALGRQLVPPVPWWWCLGWEQDPSNCEATGGCILHWLATEKISSEPKQAEITGYSAFVLCFLKLCLPMTAFPSWIISVLSIPFVHRPWKQWSLWAPVTAGGVWGCAAAPRQPGSRTGSNTPSKDHWESTACLLFSAFAGPQFLMETSKIQAVSIKEQKNPMPQIHKIPQNLRRFLLEKLEFSLFYYYYYCYYF